MSEEDKMVSLTLSCQNVAMQCQIVAMQNWYAQTKPKGTILNQRECHNPLHLLPIFISPYPVDLVYLTMAHLIICLATNHFFSSVLFGFIAKCYICQWFSNNSSTNWLNTSLSHTFYAFLFMTFISSLAACFTFYSFIKTPIFWLS